MRIGLPETTPELRAATRHLVFEGSEWSGRFVVMTLVSTVIAALGLLADSAAVVIGAMIIAPLMGPIVGIALATTHGSSKLMRRSLFTEVFGVAICLAASAIIAVLTPSVVVTSEMLARTAPTTLDLGIALASGLAAAYAIIDERVSASLAGVAVSVALVPPLATCGLLLAVGEFRLGAGALLLWFTNFVAIQLGAAAVFALFGFGRIFRRNPDAPPRYLRFVPSLVALVLVGWYLTSTLLRLLGESERRNIATTVLSREVSFRSGGRLDSIIDIRKEGNGWRVVASALTPRAFEPSDVVKMEGALVEGGIPGARLVLRSLVSNDVDRTGPVYATKDDAGPTEEERARAAVFERARNAVLAALGTRSGATLVEFTGDVTSEPRKFTAVVRTPEPFEPFDVERAQTAASEAVGGPVELVVRSVLTVAADATSRLYEPIFGPDPYEAVQARLTPVLARRLAELGARLVSLGFSPDGDETVVLADVEAARPLPDQGVRQIADDIRKNIGRSLKLKVRTTLVYGG